MGEFKSSIKPRLKSILQWFKLMLTRGTTMPESFIYQHDEDSPKVRFYVATGGVSVRTQDLVKSKRFQRQMAMLRVTVDEAIRERERKKKEADEAV